MLRNPFTQADVPGEELPARRSGTVLADLRIERMPADLESARVLETIVARLG